MKYCVKISYDGTDYHGFQIQPGLDTIQLRLEQSLSTIYKQPIRISYAGRTDAGVHATAQYIDFVAPHEKIKKENLLLAINSLLPQDIRAVAIFKESDRFNSRYSAIYRDYTYIILNDEIANPFLIRYSWHIKDSLDIDAMKSIKHIFEGKKDFRFVANEPENKNCIRHVHFLHVKKFRKFIIINIRANGFLRGMVRNIVGILVAFGRNTLKINISDNIIRQQTELKSLKAPPNGLFLTKVNYFRGVE